MAERPVFVPASKTPSFVKSIPFEIKWAPGFALVQKHKNVHSLHVAAAAAGLSPLLEISSKSTEKVGRHLSAFNLKVESKLGEIPLECAFQGSKVFERGGPYTDLYQVAPKIAKKDSRLRESGRLIRFNFEGKIFPIIPPTVFYDWLYLKALLPHKDWLQRRIMGDCAYKGFTDIEFNPEKSINCQAKSCALFVALMEIGLLETALASPDVFIKTMKVSESHLTPIEARATRLQTTAHSNR